MASSNGHRAVAPSEFPPPVDPAAEFVGPPTDAEDERIEVGVAIVGGGQAGLACAIRLLQLLEDDPALMESLGEVPVAVIEKGRVAGAHQLSGGVMNPSAIRDAVPGRRLLAELRRGGQGDRLLDAQPASGRCRSSRPRRRSATTATSSSPSPSSTAGWGRRRRRPAPTSSRRPSARSCWSRRGRSSASARATRAATSPAARSPTSSRARTSWPARPCSPRAAGAISPAPRSRSSGSPRSDPQVWALGVKEVWEVEQPLDRVIHTLGWPLRYGAKYKEFGGSWIYPMNREGEPDRVSIGFVVGLDYADARLSVHDVLQEFKHHKLVRKILGEGKRVAWGAKAIPEGGYWAMPRLHAPGMVIAGDAARHGQRAQAQGHPLRDPLGHVRRGDARTGSSRPARRDFSAYEQAVHDSEIGKDLYESRNMKQPFGKGFFLGGAITNAMVVTKGRIPGGHWPTHRDADQELMLTDRARALPEARRQVHVRQALGRLHHGQRDARRRAEPHPHPAAGAARARRGVAVDVPRGRLRGPRGRARERLRRPRS